MKADGTNHRSPGLDEYSHMKTFTFAQRSETREQESENVTKMDENSVVARRSKIAMKSRIQRGLGSTCDTPRNGLSALAFLVPTSSNRKNSPNRFVSYWEELQT